MTEMLALLWRVRSLLADESHWTNGTNARNKEGRPADPQSTEAVCWCLVGATVRSSLNGVAELDTLRFLDEVSGGDVAPGYSSVRPAAQYNDTHSHEEVLALLDKAIKEAVYL